MNRFACLLIAVAGLAAQPLIAQTETLAPLKDDRAPQTSDEMWAGFNPQNEPLDTEVLKEWEEDGVTLKVLRYRIGIFKGKKAVMAAIYGYPEEGTGLPGLVQIHGGGQYADYRAVLTNAKRGYATISLAWAGRINAPGYIVNPEIVKLFWDGKTNDPKYKLTTDWGAVDGYHAGSRGPVNAFSNMKPHVMTLDPVESCRNNGWFLVTLGARRALTFLEQQPQVDKSRLGVYGHSMGGKLTVMTAAADSRVKAAAPSCGGVSSHMPDKPLWNKTIGDESNLPHISCPIMFLSPANDFHSRLDDLQTAVKVIKSRDWRVTCSPHHNHQDTANFEVATQLWFDQYLKGAFTFPQTPQTSLDLKTQDGAPLFTVTPDKSRRILSVDVFYTQQGRKEGETGNTTDSDNAKNRFWHHAEAVKKGDTWLARLPLFSTDKPLWVYANVLYPLEKPVTGSGYYYAEYTADCFNLSSLMSTATPTQLTEANVKATLKPSLVIETFEGDWEKEWFTYKPQDWARMTHKIYDDQWKAPAKAQLALEVRSENPNKLVIRLDKYAAEIQLAGGPQWQGITLNPADFQNALGEKLSDWNGLKELGLSARQTLREKVAGKDVTLNLGADWQGGQPPQFRNLRWTEDSEVRER